MNRLRGIRASHPKADYWVSQEGGLVTDGDSFYNRAWILFADKTPVCYGPTLPVSIWHA